MCIHKGQKLLNNIRLMLVLCISSFMMCPCFLLFCISENNTMPAARKTDVCTRSHFPALFLSLTQNTWWHEKDCGGQEND